MQLEIGKIYNGTVKAITQYGAFVDVEGGGSGMIHISEVANTYVNDIHEFLTEGQEIRVKVIGINDNGKVSLSLKKAQEDDGTSPKPEGGSQNRQRRDKSPRPKPNIWEPKQTIPQSEMTFEDRMSHFKQTSEERIGEGKRRTDRRNGTRRK